MDQLNIKKTLRLDSTFQLEPLKNPKKKRSCKSDEINQVWRYGGSLKTPMSDLQLERKLMDIKAWIEGELK